MKDLSETLKASLIAATTAIVLGTILYVLLPFYVDIVIIKGCRYE